jgi:hypothetical protein
MTIEHKFLHSFCSELENRLAIELELDGQIQPALLRRLTTDEPLEKHQRNFRLKIESIGLVTILKLERL